MAEEDVSLRKVELLPTPLAIRMASLPECEGVHFREMGDNGRLRIFDVLADEFVLRRARITRHLIGDKGLQDINLRRSMIAVGDSEHELLYQALDHWYKEKESPTGQQLYQALCLAGCERGQLKQYEGLLGLTPKHSRMHPSPPQREHKTHGLATTHGDGASNPDDASLRQKVAFLQQQMAAMETRVEQVTRQRLYSRPLGARNWRQLPPMPGRKMCCRVVGVGDYVVVVGGFSGDDMACDDVYAFHTMTHRWDIWLSTPNALCAAASDGDSLYVVGGCPLTGGEAVRDVFRLSADRNEWRPLPEEMPHGCCDAAATIHKNRLYVLGGESSWKTDIFNKIACNKVRSVTIDPLAHHLQIYDFDEKIWQLGKSLFVDDPYTNNDCLIAYGQYLICDRLHCYDTDNDEWRELPERRCGSTTAMAVIDNCVLTIGGGYPASERVDMLVLRNAGWRWEALSETRTSRRGAAATELNGIVYLAGGQSVYGDVLDEFEFFM